MTIETITGHGEPDPGRADPALPTQAGAGQEAQAAHEPPADAALQAHATDAVTGLLAEQPAMAKEIKDTLRTRVHAQELARRADAAEAKAADAEQRESNLSVKLDPGQHRTLAFGLGAAIIVALVVLDTFPLNWAAQAFDLDAAGTWLVTFILVIASIGAMLGFEITRGHARRHGILIAVVTAGYLALLGLRTEYLTTVAGDSFLIAVFQSALLTAISAGLVLCGSAVLARTRSFVYSRARAEARRAIQAAEDARKAEVEATDKLHRHIGTLHHMLLPWALLHSPAPQGVDHAKWATALEQAIRAPFTLT
jgi:uncharacterized membrane protein YgcG